MKSFKILITYFLTFLLFISCTTEKQSEIIPEISIPIDQENFFIKDMIFDNRAEEKTFCFQTNTNWEITIIEKHDENWCNICPTSGNAGTHVISVKVTDNDNYEDRQIILTLTADTLKKDLKIVQKGKKIPLLSKNEFEVESKGGKIEVEVKSNFKFHIQMPRASWISKKESWTSSVCTIIFEVKENTEYNDRNANILFYDENREIEKNLYIHQNQKDVINVEKKEYIIGSEGGHIEIKTRSNVKFHILNNNNWIEQIVSRSLNENVYTFSVQPNEEYISRTGEILFESENKSISEKITVKQNKKTKLRIEYYNETEGDLYKIENEYNLKDISYLKINGMLNKDDINFINNLQSDIDTLDIKDILLFSIPYVPNHVNYIILPKSLERIERNTFANSIVNEVIIPANVSEIKSNAFSYSKIKKVSFEKGSQITTIYGGFYGFSHNPEGAFCNCRTLETIIIPASVKIIQGGAFAGCTSLKNVIFEKDSQLVELEGDFKYDGSRGAFQGCTALERITIPKSVTVISFDTFLNCTSLEEVIFEPESKLKIIKGSYIYDTNNKGGAFCNCTSLKKIDIPATVTEIGSAAFRNCTSLETVNIPYDSQLEFIRGGLDAGAFINCKSLRYIYIPKSVKHIGLAAFKSCTSLQKVTFEKGSELKVLSGEIDTRFERDYYMGIFADCTSLQSITIPASVEIIQIAAFKGCESLQKISFERGSRLTTIEGTEEYTNYGTFYGNKNLQEFDASECKNLNQIGGTVFFGDNKLNVVKLGSTIPPHLGKYAFYGINKQCTLMIPTGTYDTYKGWNTIFSNITEY